MPCREWADGPLEIDRVLEASRTQAPTESHDVYSALFTALDHSEPLFSLFSQVQMLKRAMVQLGNCYQPLADVEETDNLCDPSSQHQYRICIRWLVAQF